MRSSKALCRFVRWVGAGGRRQSAGVAFLIASLLTPGANAQGSAVAKIAISASPTGTYFGERPVEGVMDFRGSKYLLTLQGISGSASSIASVFGLRRARDIEGPYTQTADGLHNPSGVRIRFDPPVSIGEGPLKISLASRLYPKVSTGQGNDLE
jgi:hypothetical protein